LRAGSAFFGVQAARQRIFIFFFVAKEESRKLALFKARQRIELQPLTSVAFIWSRPGNGSHKARNSSLFRLAMQSFGGLPQSSLYASVLT